eukprot:15449376-Alexandrium_andersonii.AAC.1
MDGPRVVLVGMHVSCHDARLRLPHARKSFNTRHLEFNWQSRGTHAEFADMTLVGLRESAGAPL